MPCEVLSKNGLSSSFREREMEADSMSELMLRVRALRKLADSRLRFCGSPTKSGDPHVHSATTTLANSCQA